MDVLDLATVGTVVTALLFAWRVAATIRRVDLGAGSESMPAEGLHSKWPDDLRDLVRSERPPLPCPMPPPVSIYAQLVAALGVEPIGG